MPIVRFSRDKRGLDTLYLIDTRPDTGRRSGGARVLYFWTAPPGLRVGRAALDESRQRELERAHPDIVFDWPSLIKAVDAARFQAAALSADGKREAWRSGARTSRATRPGGRSEPPPVNAAPVAPAPTRAVVDTPAAPPVIEDQADPATSPAGASEEGDAARRPRRRRRRTRRPGSPDETPSAQDPIIES